jgi:hypothetical protein
MTEVVNSTSQEELVSKLSYLLERLIRNIYHNDLDLYRYLESEVPNIAAELRTAVNYNTLRNMI